MSMNRYGVNTSFFSANKFYIFVGFPLLANLVVANNFTIPSYYSDMNPVIVHFILQQNKKFLAHLKNQYKKYPEQFAHHEINVFTQHMRAKEFKNWRESQTVYQFDAVEPEEMIVEEKEFTIAEIDEMIKQAIERSKRRNEKVVADDKDGPSNPEPNLDISSQLLIKEKAIISNNVSESKSDGFVVAADEAEPQVSTSDISEQKPSDSTH